MTLRFRWCAWIEQSVQLLKETRAPIAAQAEKPERIDYEYERNGTATIFLFTEPSSGFRYVSVRELKIARNWVEEMKYLLDSVYPEVV